ncbi:hypothetical protein AAG570_004117 [Ranatra chinensis]|uniref:Uncharacterized protein n=1 Tax=Ranatra chinensis TaxID=642074 RepID=A0ABD0Y2U7_9HEMI
MNSPSRNKLPNSVPISNSKQPFKESSRHSGVEFDVLLPDNKTPVKSPSRTPVTENDPLGALNLDEVNQSEQSAGGGDELRNSVLKSQPEIELDDSGAPVLFDRRRLETGESDDDDESRGPTYDGDDPHSTRKKPIARSSTMPASNHKETATFPAFKLPFTPSSLTSKKSNELLMGGLSSLKSAATSVAKKFDEIKEAISSNSTPIKGGKGTLERDGSYFEDESEYGGDDSLMYRRKVSSEFSPLVVYHHIDSWGSNQLTEGSRKGSTTNLGKYLLDFLVSDIARGLI